MRATMMMGTSELFDPGSPQRRAGLAGETRSNRWPTHRPQTFGPRFRWSETLGAPVSTDPSEVRPPARSRDLERFITFIDAIVAIAITLLVLPLVDLVTEIEPGDSVQDLLMDHKAPIGAFLLSFAVIANLWMIQHRMLSNVREGNDALTRLLLLWSLTIVVLPFPTSLAAGPYGTGDQTATKVFYVGTMMLSSFLLSAIALLLRRRPQLRDNETTPDVWRSCTASITFVVALLVMVLFPATGYWPLLLLVASDRASAVAKAAVDRWRVRAGSS